MHRRSHPNKAPIVGQSSRAARAQPRRATGILSCSASATPQPLGRRQWAQHLHGLATRPRGGATSLLRNDAPPGPSPPRPRGRRPARVAGSRSVGRSRGARRALVERVKVDGGNRQVLVAHRPGPELGRGTGGRRRRHCSSRLGFRLRALNEAPPPDLFEAIYLGHHRTKR